MSNPEVLYCPTEKIKEAAQQFPTPFFLYKEDRLRENVQRLKSAFTKYFPDFELLYAVKANPNPEVLKILIEEGCGFDTSSYAEAYLAEKLNAKGMHTSSYTSVEDLKKVLEGSLILNVDDASMLPTVKKIQDEKGEAMPETLAFRVNPGLGQGGAESLVFAGPDAKYGIPHEDAAAAYKQAQEMGVKNFGIHMMTGSNVLENEYFPMIFEKLLRIIGKIKEDTGIEIDFMNIGGGFGVPYRPESKSLNLEEIAKNIHELMTKLCPEIGITQPRLMAEPGRYIGADMGFLVGEVIVIKDGYKKFIGIDASSNDMPRPSIYDAYHHATLIPRNRDESSQALETVSIVGSICENSDQFAKDRSMPPAQIGDLMAIHNCGAHAHAMGHNYNGKLRHAEILWQSDGSFRQIRRAETLEDFFATLTSEL
jgi:diaminopimelate decarboxylase